MTDSLFDYLAVLWLRDHAAEIPLVTTIPDIIEMLPDEIPRTRRLTTSTVPGFLKDELHATKHPMQVRLSDHRKVYVWVLHGHYSSDFTGHQYATMYENYAKKKIA